jgi:preprotein translocase SecE subunit
MALAVKNTPDTSTSQLLDRLSVGILMGVAYVLGSLGVLFKAIPFLWWSVFAEGFASWSLFIAVICVAAVALAFLGLKLMGPHPMPGLKVGIFATLASLLLALLLARLIGGWIEQLTMQETLGLTPMIGTILAVIVAVALGIAAIVLVVRSKSHKWLQTIEDQGWFSGASYKRSQGLLVRRGTMAGLLGVVGCGVFLMVTGSLLVGSTNWQINIPFSGKVTITDPRDAAPAGLIAKLPEKDRGFVRVVSKGGTDLPEGKVVASAEFDAARDKAKADGEQPPTSQWVLDRFAYRDDVEEPLKKSFVKIANAGDEDSPFTAGQVVEKSKFDAERSKLEKANKKDKDLPEGVSKDLLLPVTSVEYASLTLFPYVKLTLPLFVVAFALWFSWRLVNMPVFADFLIATEAELNKVSWTTRTRLKQDTIVVLVTVVLLSIFILTMDTAWYKLLSWDMVRVLQVQKEGKGEERKEVPW